MSSCPNPNTPEWKALVKAFGEGNAQTAFDLNQGQVPTVEKTRELLKNQKTQDKDEQFVTSSEKFKLDRIVAQNTSLDTVRLTKANDAQKKTIESLMTMNQSLQDFYNRNIELAKDSKPIVKSVSVSTFIGASDFTGDASKYESFKLFGTFMHEVLELAQLESLKTGVPIDNVITNEFFKTALEKYSKKYPFAIDNLSTDEMYDMVLMLSKNLNFYNNQGFLILPEITVTGLTENGTRIVGRLDLLMIDGNGNAHIFDFKTKKVNWLSYTDPSANKTYPNKNLALVHLAEKTFPISEKAGTEQAFKKQNRSTYDTWTLQLKVYENMLAQNSIPVESSSIASLMYQTDEETNAYKTHAVHVFTGENFYNYATNANLPDELQNAKKSLYTLDSAASEEWVKELRDIVDRTIPVGEKKEEEEKAKGPDISDLKISKKSDTKLKERLKIAIESELADVLTKLKETDEKKQPYAYNILKTRSETLRRFNDILLRTEKDEDLSLAYNFSLALDAVEDDIFRLSETVDKAMETFKLTKDSRNSKEGVDIRDAYKKSRGLDQVLNLLKETVAEIREDKEKAEANKEILKIVNERIDKISSKLGTIESSFGQVSLHGAISVLKGIGDKVFVEVNEGLKEGYKLKLKQLENQLERLKEGKNATVLKELKHQALLFMSSEYKKRVAEKIQQNNGGTGAEVLVQMESLERQILEYKLLIEGGIKLDDEFLTNYLQGARIATSTVYAGNPDSFGGGSSIMSGVMLDQGIASASNSDLAIAAYTMMFKNAEGAARLAIQNSYAAMQFDQKRDKLLERYTVEQLNEMVSEYRTESFTNKDGTVEDRRFISIKNPVSAEYEKTYRDYNSNLRQYKKEIEQLLIEKHKKFQTPDEAAAKKAYLDKRKEHDNYRKEYIQWLIDNARTPYKQEFYELQKFLPEEIRDQLQNKYMEIEEITLDVGKGNEVLLEDYDFDRLEELEEEIRKLKQEAKRISPEYAEYMEKFNDLYEFDTDVDFYNRMKNKAESRFAQSQPDIWEKWLKNNEMQRPTRRPELPAVLQSGQKVFYQDSIYTVNAQRSEGSVEMYDENGVVTVAMYKDLQSLNWYEELNLLYEERANVVAGDPKVEELMKERRGIIAPYKVAGSFRPKNMSEADVTRLDQIEGELEDIFEESKAKNKLEPSQLTALKNISQQIQSLSRKEISKGYTETFKNRLEILNRAYQDMLAAENTLSNLVTNAADKEEITKAEENLTKVESAFGKEQAEFEKWYNLHHVDKYKSITTGHNIRQFAQPKSYNYERVPSTAVQKQYMESIPHPKYKIKRIKESAKNPDFLKNADGIPLPKALSIDADGKYVVTPGYENSPNISEGYRELSKNTEVFSFYNDLLKLYLDMQSKVEGRKLGYKVPGFAASTIENLTSKGLIDSFKSERKKFVERNLKGVSEIDANEGTFGSLNGQLRQRYTQQLSEDFQTRDVIGAIVKYTIEAQMNIAMQEVAPKADAFIEYFELQASKLQREKEDGKKLSYTDASGNLVTVDMEKRLAGLQNLLTITRYERNKFLYGQYESGAAANKKFAKITNAMFTYSSFIRIGFDVANQAKNYISGNVQAFIAAGGLESDRFTRKDFMWAKSKVYGRGGFLSNYMTDLGRIGSASQSTMLYRFFNPAQKDFMKYAEEITGGRSRKIKSKLTSPAELGFMLQDKGDTEIAVTVMYSVLNHNRYKVFTTNAAGEKVYEKDANGEDVTVAAHEIYYKDQTGQLVRRKDVEYDQEDENRLRNIIYSEMRRAQGNYAKADQSRIEETIGGKFLYFFKKYLVPQFLNRFGYLRANWEGSEVALGYWRAVGMAIKNYGPMNTLKHVFYGSNKLGRLGEDQMGPMMTRKVKQAGRDALFMAVLSTMAMMALMYVRRKDDEDEELGFLEGNAIRILWGVQGETASMFPIGGGSDEYIRNFTSLTTYTREFTAAQKLIAHSYYWTMAMILNSGEEPDTEEDSEYYQTAWKKAFYSRTSGAYEKGDSKISKDFMDLTGLKNFRDLLDPNYRIDQLKRNQ